MRCPKSLTYGTNKLDFDPRVFQSLAIFGSDRYCSLDGLSIHIQWGLLATILVELDINHGPVIGVLEDNVDVHRCREEVSHLACSDGLFSVLEVAAKADVELAKGYLSTTPGWTERRVVVASQAA